MELDRIDFEILRRLQKDARIPNKALAAEVGLAGSTCYERVKRLKASGVLGEAHAEVDPAVLGIGLQAFVAIRMKRHTREGLDRFIAEVRGLKEVVAVYHVSGKDDFLVHVAVRDVHHLRDLALDAFTTREELDHIETSLVFNYHRNPVLPNYTAEEEGKG